MEAQAKAAPAVVSAQTDNGTSFTLKGVAFQTLYDGSQDFEGTKNDDVLTNFFEEFEGDHSPALWPFGLLPPSQSSYQRLSG